MSNRNWLLKTVKAIGLVFILGVSMSACGVADDHWKEEVLLHDGTKMIVDRWQSYGGGHEIGVAPPVNKVQISFTLPGTNQVISWKETLNDDPESESLILLAVGIVNRVPYLVTSPVGMLPNNKWGCRVEPRYVALKYVGQAWKQIQMNELPVEIKNANVLRRTQSRELSSHHGPVTVDEIKAMNYEGGEEYQKVFERPPVGSLVPTECPKTLPISSPKAPNQE